MYVYTHAQVLPEKLFKVEDRVVAFVDSPVVALKKPGNGMAVYTDHLANNEATWKVCIQELAVSSQALRVD